MQKGKVLIIDDNKGIQDALELLLLPVCTSVVSIPGPKRLIPMLETGEFDLVLLDMNFSAGVNTGNEGIYWLKRIREINPDIPVILITAYGDVELAVKALKEGATDFILKPWDNQKLIATVQAGFQLRWSRLEVRLLKQKEGYLKKELNKENIPILGNSVAIQQMQSLIGKVAKTDANVLITGENGTGKELVAREIHRLSGRSQEILVTVDMGAISDTLFESELFGHVKGAFTDAREDRAGKMEAANGGTLFLDEIGNLGLPLQAKLLAALQNREITRLGSNKAIGIDFRLISATNRDLTAMITEGQFREDLLYRLNTIHIEVPPLRERGTDVLLLAEHFIRKFASRYDKPNLHINQQANEKLQHYSWPGNIRELQHTIEKAVILSEGPVLKPDLFFFKPLGAAKVLKDMTLEEMEKNLIAGVLQKAGGNLSLAAQHLGVTRQTLYNKIKKYGL
ncbi:MAG: sigma-54-dependent Fis family transcriptional regulator [Bacteroidetes bacterium]|nr:sigma-54-dependent Fis family transcriptional regulator [Bacteroidota bacterium]